MISKVSVSSMDLNIKLEKIENLQGWNEMMC
jgi:hypothetical protein